MRRALPCALRGVTKVYDNGVAALGPLDLDVAKGEFVSLLGPSGCGKSTALRLIAGLSAPSAGTVNVSHRATRADGRHPIGFVFQEPTLMPWASVRENVRLPLKLSHAPATDADSRIEEALAQVGLAEFADAYPRELSGGMKMRVSLARALVTDPDILLLDEPFAALDEITRFRLNNDLLDLWRKLHKTVIFVTHSVFESVYLSQRVTVMTARPGRLASDVSHRHSRAARGGVSHLGRICRLLPRGLQRAGTFLFRAAQRMSSFQNIGRMLLPIAVLAAGLGLWELVVRVNDIQPYVLPSPYVVFQTLVGDWPVLAESLGVTLLTTLEGFIAAAIGGIALALLFNQSKWLEYSLFPYAVILQVTPVIAIAPLLLIYLPQQTAVIVCAWIVGFFPVLSNTTLGLNSVDRNLAGLFQLYGASRLQTLRYLKLPAALPYILGGLRIAGGLSLIGAVVAEIAAGTAGAGSGLAFRIAESGYRLNIPRMFAALLLLSVAGIVIYGLLALVSHLVLRRWHESALGKEN
jgi:NitT/TauT family transport system permease protein